MIVLIKISTASIFRLQTSYHLSKELKVTGMIADNHKMYYVYPHFYKGTINTNKGQRIRPADKFPQPVPLTRGVVFEIFSKRTGNFT